MARAIPVDIAGEHFPTKGAALERCSRILNSYPGRLGTGPGQPEDVTDPEHIAFLTVLVARHPDDKIGSGIAGFRVQVNPEGTHNTRCFHVVHPDGSLDDFGYKYCI